MEAKSTDNKTFQLTQNGQLLGELIYESLFSYKAEIKLADAGQYNVKPTGIFATSIAVTKKRNRNCNVENELAWTNCFYVSGWTRAYF